MATKGGIIAQRVKTPQPDSPNGSIRQNNNTAQIPPPAWTRSKSKSSASVESATGASQARLVGRLARPKQHPQEGQQEQQEERVADRVVPDRTPVEHRAARRPSLKRQVKSQGDIPDPDPAGATDGRLLQRRTSTTETTGFPSLLPHRRDPGRGLWRRAAGPGSGATAARPGEEGAAAAATGRRTLPHGAPRRSAWPPRHDEGDIIARQFTVGVEEGFRGGGEGSAVGGGGGGGGESRASICAIEAMLEEGGGDSYLPARVRDLPEAEAILGPRGSEEVSDSKPGGSSGGSAKPRRGGAKSSKGVDATRDGRTAGSGRNDPEVNNGDGGGATGTQSPGGPRRGRGGAGLEERFLHPWQRALEASKRASNAREQHEAALLREQRRRSEARRAAAASKDCRRAGRRVAARLGRHEQHRRRRRRRRRSFAEHGGHGERNEGQPTHPGLSQSGAPGSLGGGRSSRGMTHQNRFDSDDEGGGGNTDCLRQMRDALGWARKTFGALVQRLKDRGIAVESGEAAMIGRSAESTGGERAMKDWETVRVANKLRRRLAAFEDESVTFGAEAAAAAAAAAKGVAVAGRNTAATPLWSKCEVACESFEVDFCRMIDELSAMAKTHPSPPSLHSSPRDGDGAGGSTRRSASVVSEPISGHSVVKHSGESSSTSTTAVGATSGFGLCPSCSVLPVSRRCLDCDGEHADRDRCSSCFYREHRGAPRHLHRFLRISGGGNRAGGAVDSAGSDGSAGGDEGVSTTEQLLGAPGKNARAHDSGSHKARVGGAEARCSRCGDLAAARRCRDCRVDTCAACHFLAHRSPSRRSHVTEFVGKAAVALQEALYTQNLDQAAETAAAAAAAASAAAAATTATVVAGEARRNGGRDDGAGGEGGADEEAPGESAFGKGAEQSLAQVRSTIDAPVVRPRSRSSTEGGLLSRGRIGGGADYLDGAGLGDPELEGGGIPEEVDGGGSGSFTDSSRRGAKGWSIHSDDGSAGDEPGPAEDDISVEDDIGIANGEGTPAGGRHAGASGNRSGGGGNNLEMRQGGDDVDENSESAVGIVQGEGEISAAFGGSRSDLDGGYLLGWGQGDVHRQRGVGTVCGKASLSGGLEEIREEGEEEEGEGGKEKEEQEEEVGEVKEERTGRVASVGTDSTCSSSDEDTDDEGMVSMYEQSFRVDPERSFATCWFRTSTRDTYTQRVLATSTKIVSQVSVRLMRTPHDTKARHRQSRFAGGQQ